MDEKTPCHEVHDMRAWGDWTDGLASTRGPADLATSCRVLLYRVATVPRRLWATAARQSPTYLTYLPYLTFCRFLATRSVRLLPRNRLPAVRPSTHVRIPVGV